MLQPRIASILARKKEEGQKITQVSIAEKLKVSTQQVSAWISGQKYPRLEKAFELAEVLGCKVDDLYEKKSPSPE